MDGHHSEIIHSFLHNVVRVVLPYNSNLSESYRFINVQFKSKLYNYRKCQVCFTQKYMLPCIKQSSIGIIKAEERHQVNWYHGISLEQGLLYLTINDRIIV